MNDDKKELTVKNVKVDHSGMVTDIFKHVIYLVREMLKERQHNSSLMWNMFLHFAEEYKKASRPKLFGSLSPEEVLEKAYESALKQTQKLSSGFHEEDDRLGNLILQVTKGAPGEFLSAVKEVMAQENGKNQLQKPGEEIGQYALEELLKKMAAR